jgi:5'(3')-deoxyribonucleotidase
MEKINWVEVQQIAERIAVEAHRGQLDKLGYSYIGHPRRVARNAATIPLSNEELRGAAVAAAWLHDVIEDNENYNAAKVLALGVPQVVVDAVLLVSDMKEMKSPSESPIQKKAVEANRKFPYYEAIKASPLARAVKLADLADNCNEQRVAELIAAGSPISDGKYPLALAVLEPNVEEWAWFNKAIKKVPDRIIYIDMDNVIVDFETGIEALDPKVRAKFPNDEGIDDADGIFGLMVPYPDSVAAVKQLAEHNEVYILSTAPWNNPSAWSDKLKWVHKHFGEKQFDEEGKTNWLFKRLIISHHKHLNHGEYLIDDRLANGAKHFKGIHVHFGDVSAKEQRDGTFKNWTQVLEAFKRDGLLGR